MKKRASELRQELQDRKAGLEGDHQLFVSLQEAETKSQAEQSKRRIKIAELEAKAKNDALSSGLKGYLTKLQNAFDAEEALSKQRQNQIRANAPSLFGNIKGAEKDIGMIGRVMQKTADQADNWGSRLDGVATVLTRITPILRGLGILIGVTLASSITALVASLGAAAGAVAALAASFLAALGPVIAVVVGFFTRLAAVTQVLAAKQNVLKQANKASADAEKNSAAQAEKLRNARNTLRDATQAGEAAERSLAEAKRQAAADMARAAQQEIEASRNLIAANRDLKQATVDAYRAIEDAAEDARDAVLDLEGAQLDLEGAKLDTKEARRDLAAFRKETGLLGTSFDDIFKKFQDVDVNLDDLLPALQGAGADVGADQGDELQRKVHALREARLREKQAIDGVDDAETALNDKRAESNRLNKEGIGGVEAYADAVERQRTASQDLRDAQAENNRLQKQGVDNAPSVLAAQDALRDAKERETEASKDLKAARKGEAAGLDSLNSSLEDYMFQLGQLSDAEQGFVAAIGGIGGAFKDVVQSGTDPIFVALTDIIPKLKTLGPLLKSTFSGIGTGIGKGLTSFFDLIANPITQINLATIAGAAQRLVDVIGQRIIGAAFTAFINVAVAAMPVLEKAFNGLADLLEGFSSKTAGLSATEGTLKLMVDSLKGFWDLTKAAAEAFGLFVRDAAGPGNKIVKFLTDGAKGMVKFLRSSKGREKVQASSRTRCRSPRR